MWQNPRFGNKHCYVQNENESTFEINYEMKSYRHQVSYGSAFKHANDALNIIQSERYREIIELTNKLKQRSYHLNFSS